MAPGPPFAPDGPPVPLIESAAHVFVADLDQPVLDDEDRHHLLRVLRLRDGEVVSAADGAGRWRSCRLAGTALVPGGDVLHEPPPEPPITIAFAVPKGDRPEWIVQKLTEIGADVIVPMISERSVVRWDAERAGKHVVRLAKVVRAAAMQSRRTRIPVVEPLSAFAPTVARPGAALAVPGGPWPDLTAPVVLIGPEGGWADAELDAAPRRVGLGRQVLRAETAAIVACTLLVAARARWVDT
jgi:16S rRNA (uracil1498-N3)-methyltransferase